jgi:hypothetical protein
MTGRVATQVATLFMTLFLCIGATLFLGVISARESAHNTQTTEAAASACKRSLARATYTLVFWQQRSTYEAHEAQHFLTSGSREAEGALAALDAGYASRLAVLNTTTGAACTALQQETDP